MIVKRHRLFYRLFVLILTPVLLATDLLGTVPNNPFSIEVRRYMATMFPIEFVIPLNEELTHFSLPTLPIMTGIEPETPVIADTTTPSPTLTVTATLTATSTLTPIITSTSTITSTPTLTPTIDRSRNTVITFVKGNTTELVTCENIEFQARVTDPNGVARVYIQFFVGGNSPNYSNINAEIELQNLGDDLWGGFFNDNISVEGQVTYWRIVAEDIYENVAILDLAGVFSYFARSFGCP